ncbi:WD40/YVTN/BNR-like repeat-containing protein [Chelatococcus asaccharovorans]|uniref:DUF6242 domain-containing protein n=1 Tax=Chelatococcus asaccharovorans TaxID=28210 RepID=A0A2V3UC08_9HYPH|nr:hypothetical protein [Chelatococcus asaccharovorans]MBS7703325.1 hypothetical protein [Chelatococcus asaccharovorans]PXW61658.1 hypothetical protein C7450_103175 [Chelatococcus asaccharovorans]
MLWEYMLGSGEEALPPDIWLMMGGPSYSGPWKAAGSSDGVNFEFRGDAFPGSSFNVCRGAGRWVSIATTNEVFTSVDGLDWTSAGMLPVPDGTTINCMAFANGLFVAAGTGGRLVTSPDGLTWTLRTSNFPSGQIGAVAYGNGIWMAVGSSQNVITSTNGTTWAAKTNSLPASNLTGAIYAMGMWVVIGTAGLLATSANNGTSWTVRNLFAGSKNVMTIAFTGTAFFAAATDGVDHVGYVSTNGTAWSMLVTWTDMQPVKITSGGSRMALLGYDGATPFVKTSTNHGASWSPITIPAELAYVGAIAYAG